MNASEVQDCLETMLTACFRRTFRGLIKSDCLEDIARQAAGVAFNKINEEHDYALDKETVSDPVAERIIVAAVKRCASLPIAPAEPVAEGGGK